MSRGFDGFEIDDFRGSDSDPGRDAAWSSSSDWNKWTELHNIHREEERADRLDREGRDRSEGGRPPLPREDRVQAILSQRIRNQYTDRNKSLFIAGFRDSHAFRSWQISCRRQGDLADVCLQRGSVRVENDVESLVEQGLMKETAIADLEHSPTQVVTLTKEGHKLLISRQGSPSQPSYLPRTQETQEKLSTMRNSTGSITRSAMKLKAVAAESSESSSTMK